jgi:hypothetical protein
MSVHPVFASSRPEIFPFSCSRCVVLSYLHSQFCLFAKTRSAGAFGFAGLSYREFLGWISAASSKISVPQF